MFGSGIMPGFYGPTKTQFFSQEGDWIGYEANVQSKCMVGKGLTKIDVVSDANPATQSPRTRLPRASRRPAGT